MIEDDRLDYHEGDEAEVHQSLLEPVRLLWAPYMPALVNLMLWFVLTFGAQIWLWGIVTVIVHVFMVLATRKDIYALEVLRRYCMYADYYDV